MEKKKYKVMGDTKNTFLDIELDLVIEDETLGTEVNVLGGTFKITQNGNILVLAEPEWVLTLQDITPAPVVVKPKLEVNKTYDIFFGPKEIDVRIECTYEELFYALQQEWKMAGVLAAEVLPFDYTERLKLFTFKNGWGFSKENGIKYIRNGSFTRISEDGRSI